MNSPEKTGKLQTTTAVGDAMKCAEALKNGQDVKGGHEEDLEATEKAIQERAEAVASINRRPSTSEQQLSVFDFLLNFLFQHGMTGTLACFEAEWSELLQNGEVDAKEIDLIPKVYTESEQLAGELKSAWREKEEYRQAAAVAAEALQRAKRAKDAHWLEHQRLVRENNKLIGDMQKLKVQCEGYQPEVKRMSDKYQAMSKQVVQVALERDKALLQGDHQAARLDASSSQTNGNNGSLN
ncbi:sperm-associated antigen 16 protein-like [Poeciliopsis prolifica]|uniref:sperm-associated antigen 16 protein-like n=1 Tax=Poeciliopsis prolifica TaxID=188132 RepID=UPI00241318FA|nr:sperm-associated antigen 16 protein-like [Poeciliopsis prolifica]